MPYAVEDEEGEVLPGRGFDVTERPYRLKDADGRVHERVYVLGMQLASVQWGVAGPSVDTDNPIVGMWEATVERARGARRTWPGR